jgi:N4-(beta-N-acetylglucosaminyl)-L-asparaginase
MSNIDRRTFLTVAAAAPAASVLAGPRHLASAPAAPVSISSGNGMAAVTRAVELIEGGAPPVDAVVAGVTIVEDDPKDMSVGYGGLPNEDGVVQLDASVMDGPMHKAGAVAAIERIRNPAQVALTVLRRTDHVLLVGDGARRFAVATRSTTGSMTTRPSIAIRARRWPMPSECPGRTAPSTAPRWTRTATSAPARRRAA